MSDLLRQFGSPAARPRRLQRRPRRGRGLRLRPLDPRDPGLRQPHPRPARRLRGAAAAGLRSPADRVAMTGQGTKGPARDELVHYREPKLWFLSVVSLLVVAASGPSVPTGPAGSTGATKAKAGPEPRSPTPTSTAAAAATSSTGHRSGGSGGRLGHRQDLLHERGRQHDRLPQPERDARGQPQHRQRHGPGAGWACDRSRRQENLLGERRHSGVDRMGKPGRRRRWQPEHDRCHARRALRGHRRHRLGPALLVELQRRRDLVCEPERQWRRGRPQHQRRDQGDSGRRRDRPDLTTDLWSDLGGRSHSPASTAAGAATSIRPARRWTCRGVSRSTPKRVSSIGRQRWRRHRVRQARGSGGGPLSTAGATNEAPISRLSRRSRRAPDRRPSAGARKSAQPSPARREAGRPTSSRRCSTRLPARSPTGGAAMARKSPAPSPPRSRRAVPADTSARSPARIRPGPPPRPALPTAWARRCHPISTPRCWKGASSTCASNAPPASSPNASAAPPP